MTLRHLDFPSGQLGLYGTNSAFLLNGVYAEADSRVSLVNDPDPSFSTNGRVIRINETAFPSSTLRWVLPATNTKVGIGRRLWLSGLPVSGADLIDIMDWRNGANSIIASVFVDNTGRLVGVAGATRVVSTNPVIVSNAWQHIEGVMDTAAGTIEVRVEGVQRLLMTGLTLGGPIAQIGFRCLIPSQQYLKDLSVWDGAGSYNNDFMGSIQVRELVPNADAALNWLTSAGTTGWDLLDESPPNDDTDYVYAVDPPPAASRFDLTNLPTDVTSVKGLIAVVRSRKTDGGDGNLQVGIRSGASTNLGANRAISTAYTYWTDTFETDPATGAPWLPSAVNAAQLQINRTL